MTTAKLTSLPPFSPRRPPPAKRAIKPEDIPSSVQPCLQAIYAVIHNRPRKFKKTPTTLIHPNYWWINSGHRRATRWSLYRNLLKHCLQFECQLNKSNLQKYPAPSKNRDDFAWSPVLFNHVKAEFRKLARLRSVADTQEALRRGYLLLNNFLEAERHGSSDHLNQIQMYRSELVQTRHQKVWAKVYKNYLADRKPPTPIMTGRFLRPTILNGPLPRLAHQPLHISMMISSRRKKRERRMIESRQLKDKLQLLQLENQFEKSLPLDSSKSDSEQVSSKVLDREHTLEVQSIMDRLKVINHSFDLEREREKKVYSRELLDKIEAARRRRPRVMRERNQWTRMRTRLEELQLAFDDDPTSVDSNSPESKPFFLPDRSFWAKK